MANTQTQQHLPSTPVYMRATLDGLQTNSKPREPGSASDLTACQQHIPSSSLPQGVAGATSAHGSKKSAEDATQKRELRLMKNR
ncbi:cAMP-responsive element modulator-like isoform X1 [Lates japonicus]|uniref:cAMP-responsive element modulator-like isoform X1 n=1 Tax=Lates japonicus TaxID=270547 RepID=A0AAD3RKJ7_LATJO|nr:cAMP-responsive element modulator-like isoform X1 [Lates japonicus]